MINLSLLSDRLKNMFVRAFSYMLGARTQTYSVRMRSKYLIKSYKSNRNYLVCSYDKRLAFLIGKEHLRKDGDYIEFTVHLNYKYRVFDVGDVFKNDISKRHNKLVWGDEVLKYFSIEMRNQNSVKHTALGADK